MIKFAIYEKFVRDVPKQRTSLREFEEEGATIFSFIKSVDKKRKKEFEIEHNQKVQDEEDEDDEGTGSTSSSSSSSSSSSALPTDPLLNPIQFDDTASSSSSSAYSSSSQSSFVSLPSIIFIFDLSFFRNSFLMPIKQNSDGKARTPRFRDFRALIALPRRHLLKYKHALKVLSAVSL